jgi:hypothetical protein
VTHRSERVPKGWFTDPYRALKAVGRQEDDNRPVACGDCDWRGKESDIEIDLFEIDHLNERLTPGDPSPCGLCPAEEGGETCGAFVYYDDIEIIYRVRPTILEALAKCAPNVAAKKDKMAKSVMAHHGMKRPVRHRSKR